jgi:hypothetical protein
MRPRFNGNRLVDDVAFDPRRRGQTNLEPAHPPDNPAIDDNIIGNDLALDGRTFADRQKVGANIAFDHAFNLDIARGLHIADHRQVRRQDRGRRLGFGCRRCRHIIIGRPCHRRSIGGFRFFSLGAGFWHRLIDFASRKHWLPP